MDPEHTKQALEDCKTTAADYKTLQLYMHGLHQDFLRLNDLTKLEATAGGAALALTRLEGDRAYHKDVFEKLQFNFIEQDTKEKFLRTILRDDPPVEITLANNQELETKNMELRQNMDQKEIKVLELNKEVANAIETVHQETDMLEKDIVSMTKMLHEMQEMEAELAALRSVEDKYSGMTVEDAQILLEEQTQSLYKVNQEMEETISSIEDLKWQETRCQQDNQKLTVRRIQTEAQAKEAIRMSALRHPDLEAAYKECIEATKQYQEGVGLESIQFLQDSHSLILEYKITPGSATIQMATNAVNSKRLPILTQFLIKLHPKSGRLVSASIENAGCEVKDVVQMAKQRNDIAFLVAETLDRVMKAHP